MRRIVHLDAFWRTRRESVEDCAARAVRFLEGLGKIDASLATWGWTDYEHGAEFRRLPIARDALRERLGQGRNRTDLGNHVIEDLGFSLELSDRFDADRIRIKIRCGIFATLIPNSVRFEMGSWSETASVATLVAMLDQTIEAWEAVDGAVTVRGLGELFPYVQGSMYMGSCMRIAASVRDLPALPTGVRVEPRGDRSSLIVLTDERFDLDNPAHVDLARGTHAALSGAGLLELWKKQ
jgi:hypothetical protein